MNELTPEEIALGLRAVDAGWAWAVGDVVRSNYGRQVVKAKEASTLWLIGENDHSSDVHDLPDIDIYPDVTARGFVSAALAQVRARTGKVLICRAYMADRWRVEDTRGVPLSDRGDERTEAEAVVAALEATR